MKRCSVFMLTAYLLLSLTGCSWMDGSYVSVIPHQMGYNQSEDATREIADYIDLRSAIVSLIDAGETDAVFLLDNYLPEDVEKDMYRARSYTMNSYPIGAYSVDAIDYAFGTSGGQNALSITIQYRHPKADIDQIRTVRGISGAETSIAGSLNKHESSLVLLVAGYEPTDFVQWITDYTMMHPDVVMELPKVSVQVYPKQGETRVVELSFTYQNSRDILYKMQSQVKPVFSSAALYVTNDAEDLAKFTQLYSFLMERFNYKIETSLTPSYSLLCHGVGDSKAFATIYSAMCRQSGLNCVTVAGAYYGEVRYWNILEVDGIYYHVDLIESSLDGSLHLLDDDQMVGYVWDYSAYPSGGSSSANTSDET